MSNWQFAIGNEQFAMSNLQSKIFNMNKLRTFLLILLISVFGNQLVAQKKKTTAPPPPVADCYPTHWWPGMQWNKVQVLVKGKKAGFNAQRVTINYPGITLDSVHRLENSLYFALDLTISPQAQPDVVDANGGAIGTTGTAMPTTSTGRAVVALTRAEGVPAEARDTTTGVAVAGASTPGRPGPSRRGGGLKRPSPGR